MSFTINKANYKIEYCIADSLLSINIYDTKTGKNYLANKYSDEYSIYQNIGIDIFENINKLLGEDSFTIQTFADNIDITFLIFGQIKLIIKCDYIEKIPECDIMGDDFKSSLIKITKELGKCKAKIEEQQIIIDKLTKQKEEEKEEGGEYVFIDKYLINKHKKHFVVLSYFTEEILECFVNLHFNDIYFYGINDCKYNLIDTDREIDWDFYLSHENYKCVTKRKSEIKIPSSKEKISLLNHKNYHKSTCLTTSFTKKPTCLSSNLIFIQRQKAILLQQTLDEMKNPPIIYPIIQYACEGGPCSSFLTKDRKQIKKLVNFTDNDNLDLPYIFIPCTETEKDFRTIDIKKILVMKSEILTLANIQIENFDLIANFTGNQLHIINCDIANVSTGQFLHIIEKLSKLKILAILGMKSRFPDLKFRSNFFDKLPSITNFFTDQGIDVDCKSGAKITYLQTYLVK